MFPPSIIEPGPTLPALEPVIARHHILWVPRNVYIPPLVLRRHTAQRHIIRHMALEDPRLARSLDFRLAAQVRPGALDPDQTALDRVPGAGAVGEQEDDVGKPGGAAFRIRAEADIAVSGSDPPREGVPRGRDERRHHARVEQPVLVAVLADDEGGGVFGVRGIVVLAHAGFGRWASNCWCHCGRGTPRACIRLGIRPVRKGPRRRTKVWNEN